MMKNPATEMQNFRNSVAMTVTLISFGMMFASLFLGYFLMRSNAAVWPPVELQNLPKLLPFLSTLILAASSFTYFKFERGEKKKAFWLATIVLGFMFLGTQSALWNALAESGILVSHGQAPSMVYAFTWLHAAHVIIALLLVLWLGYFVFRRPEKLTTGKLVNVGKFWHFLGVVWLMMYLMLFVL